MFKKLDNPDNPDKVQTYANTISNRHPPTDGSVDNLIPSYVTHSGTDHRMGNFN